MPILDDQCSCAGESMPSVMLETVTSVQKVDGENRIAQAIFLLSKCSGLNAYIPLTLNIDLSHQLCTQVLYGVTVRAISGTQMASDFGFATAQADELSAQPAVSTSELNDADPPDLEEWGDVHNPDMDYVGVSTSELNDVDPPDLEEWGDMQSTDTDYAAWCSSSFSDELGTGNTADSFDCTTDHCHTDESKGLGNPRRLFVNNIPFRCSQKVIWTFFSQFGKVDHFQLLKTVNQKSKGRGFVTYKTEADAVKVLQLSEDELLLHGRKMMVQRAKWKQYSRAVDESLKKDVEKFDDDKVTPCEVEECQAVDDSELVGDATGCLNTDVLLHVFTYLTLQERMQAERVCRRWRAVLLIFWQHMEHLSFENCFHGFDALTDTLLRSLLKRGSAALKAVDLSSSPRFITDRGVEAVGKYCPNLQKIDMSGLPITNNGMRKFSELAKQIQCIILQKCNDIGEMGLWWLFHQCKELRHIDLTCNHRLGGKALHVLCSNVHTLILNECIKLQDLGLEKIALRCRKLHNLQLNSCISLTDAGIQHVAENCPTLSVLHLCGMFRNVTSSGLVELRRLENLTELHVHGNSEVNDHVLQVLTKCKKLRLLDVTSCHRDITDAGLASLVAYPCLQVLKMGYLHQINDGGLQPVIYAGRLVELDVRACSSLTDEVLQLLSRVCPQLRLLDLSGCRHITDLTMRAFEERAAREPDSRLEIHIGGTLIEADAVNMTGNIEVNCIDHSERHLRQDGELFVTMNYYSSDDYDEEDEESGNEADFQADGVDYCAMSNEMAELYLDGDDPLADEAWDWS